MLSWYKWPILCIVAELRMEIWTLGCQEWGWYRQNCFSRATVFYIFMKSKWKNVWFFWVVKEKNRKIPVSMYFAFTPAMIYEYMPQGHPNAKKKNVWVGYPSCIFHWCPLVKVQMQKHHLPIYPSREYPPLLPLRIVAFPVSDSPCCLSC